MSEERASEKGLFRGGAAALDGRPPLYIVTWKRSDRLNYMLLVSLQLLLTPPQLIRAIGPSAGQEGGRNAPHFHPPEGFRYAEHGSGDKALELKHGFTSLESNEGSPHGESGRPFLLLCTFKSCHSLLERLERRSLPSRRRRQNKVDSFHLQSRRLLPSIYFKVSFFDVAEWMNAWAHYCLGLYSGLFVLSRPL